MLVASRFVQIPARSRSPAIGRDERIGAVGQHDVVGRVAHTVDLDHPDARQPARAAEQGDPVVREPTLLAGVGVFGDLEVAPGEGGLGVDLGDGRRLARSVGRLSRPQQRLGRDAGEVGALAADQLTLDERDAQAAVGQGACAVFSGRAAAQHDDVVVVTHGHLRCLFAGGSAPRAHALVEPSGSPANHPMSAPISRSSGHRRTAPRGRGACRRSSMRPRTEAQKAQG